MTPRRRFAEPLLLAAFTVAGLLGSLLGEGAGKILGVAAVAVPLLAILRHGIRSARSARHRPRRHFEEESND